MKCTYKLEVFLCGEVGWIMPGHMYISCNLLFADIWIFCVFIRLPMATLLKCEQVLDSLEMSKAVSNITEYR